MRDASRASAAKYASPVARSTSTRCDRCVANGLRKPALERDEVRPVVLVAVVVDHHHDAPERGQDVERVAAEQLGILKRDLWREQRLRNAAGRVHRVQAQVPGEVRDEVEPVVGELGLDEDPSREERLDPLRGPGRHRATTPPLRARPRECRSSSTRPGRRPAPRDRRSAARPAWPSTPRR